MRNMLAGSLALMAQISVGCAQQPPQQHDVPRDHPRLLGDLDRLRQLKADRPEPYERMVAVAGNADAEKHPRVMSLALVSAIEGDADLAREAVDVALTHVDGEIRVGHVTFAHDLAQVAIAYDLCYDAWTDAERARAIDYINATFDANVNSETHVFHNAWYGYKHWGEGLAAYATYYDNPRAREILDALYADYDSRAAPALALAGDGGGWAEGYYIHYWLYEWLFFCEVARYCEGIDLYETAPGFYRNRAVASMFETYPGIGIYNSRRAIPMGDGGGITYGGDRDKTLNARRILVNRYRDDAAHQVAHAFDELTPRCGSGTNAYKDFLWRDESVTPGDLPAFKLSHISQGPGHVYARSSWDEDAVHFFFRCGDRFTAHQHLDVGHFGIYKGADLAGDGGHYYYFGGLHDVNYSLRSVAHSVMLVELPGEIWPNIRAGEVWGNDGGQHHNWRHHNGAAADVQAFEDEPALETGDMLAFEDTGDYVYMAGDCTRAYVPEKLRSWTRQIVYLRPSRFVVFDRVESTNADYRKTWQLQAAKPPTVDGDTLTITNGDGRLVLQRLLPAEADVTLASGDDLYRYDGKGYAPEREAPGPLMECRIRISPATARTVDYFVNVLTATDASDGGVPAASAQIEGDEVVVSLGATQIRFTKDAVGGTILPDGDARSLADRIIPTE